MADWKIAAEGAALHGHFSRSLAPVLEVDPGDTVQVETLDCWWSSGPLSGRGPEQRPRVPEYYPDVGHALTGPIAVRGAAPGTTLAVHVDELVPGSWGTTVAGGVPSPHARRHGIADEAAVLEWQLDPAAMTGRTRLGSPVALRPFFGVMGVAPAERGWHSTIPPRRVGGNLDCKELVAGSTIYLPVAVDGALFSVGDGHAAQGDGEVGGTAIECPMRARLRLELRPDLPVGTPTAETPAGWVTMGVADTLDAAAVIALDAMYGLMGRLLGIGRSEAAAYASVVVDTRVTQVVNQVVGVHAVLPHAAIPG